MPEINTSIIITTFGVLVVLTTALTQLFKAMFSKLPPQITATVIALILTVCAVFAYLTISGITPEWYYIVGAVVGGLFVSYTAQFGYDKFDEILKLFGGGKNEKK